MSTKLKTFQSAPCIVLVDLQIILAPHFGDDIKSHPAILRRYVIRLSIAYPVWRKCASGGIPITAGPVLYMFQQLDEGSLIELYKRKVIAFFLTRVADIRDAWSELKHINEKQYLSISPLTYFRYGSRPSQSSRTSQMWTVVSAIDTHIQNNSIALCITSSIWSIYICKIIVKSSLSLVIQY